MNWHPIVAGIVPSIGVGLVFWYAMRSVMRADRSERAALAEADAAYDAEQAKLASERRRAEAERDVTPPSDAS